MTNDPGSSGTPGEQPPSPYGSQPPSYGSSDPQPPSYGSSDPQPPSYGAPEPQPPSYGSPDAPPPPPPYGAPPPPPQYGSPQPPQYGAPQYGAPQPPPPYGAPGYGAPQPPYGVPGQSAQKVNLALGLGIAGIVFAICCSVIGIGLGIASVVLATQAEKQGLPGNVKAAKIVGFVALGLSVLSMIGGFALGLSGGGFGPRGL